MTDVTIAIYNDAGEIFGVSHVDSDIAESCIRQMRNTCNKRNNRKVKVFRCDDDRSNYDKFEDWQDHMANQRKINYLLQLYHQYN